MFFKAAVLAILYFFTTASDATSQPSSSPVPDTIVLSYPSSEVPVGAQIPLGYSGGRVDIPYSYYGFLYLISVKLQYPNGSVALFDSETGSETNGSLCSGGPGIGASLNGSVATEDFSMPMTVAGQ
jgi:hypothetical protein